METEPEYHTLAKSWGQWSAGTRFQILSEREDTNVCECRTWFRYKPRADAEPMHYLVSIPREFLQP